MIKKTKFNIISIVIFIICIIIFGQIIIKVFADKDIQKQKMNELSYEINLNLDGSMNVIETWDIYVQNTGTLFRTFTDTDEYSISDVNVVDFNKNMNLTDINKYMYHVPEGEFYGLETGIDEFEIAWGTGKDESRGNVKYQISYKVDNVIKSYNDCQEFYWKLLDSSNGIACKKISGIIKLPKPVSNIDNLKVWGHGEVNGTVERISNDMLKFDIKNFSAGKMLELRSMFTEKIFDTANIININMKDEILEEEESWAEQTNQIIKLRNIILTVIFTIEGIILLFGLVKIIQYLIIARKDGDGLQRKGIQYFRDIPRDGESTPGEAAYLYYFYKDFYWTDGKQSNVIASYILNLCLKGYIKIEKKDGAQFISVIKEPNDLKPDEFDIYSLLSDAIGRDSEIQVDKLNRFAKDKYYKYKKHIQNMLKNIERNLNKEGIIDRKKQRLYKNTGEKMIYFGTILSILFPCIFEFKVLILFITLPLFILEMIFIYKVSRRAKDNIYQLTQKGVYEEEEWKGLKKYLEKYSLIEEKGVFDLLIWEKYLVFATAFGMPKTVVDQLKAKYPYVFTEDYWRNNPNDSAILNMTCNPLYIDKNCSFTGFTHNITKSYNVMSLTYSSHMASSGGSGGGFSSGGGGRWWPEAGMGGR